MKIRNLLPVKWRTVDSAVGAPVRSRFWGFYFIALAPAVLLAGILMIAPPPGSGEIRLSPSLLLYAVSLAIALVLRGIRLLLKDPISVIEKDPRPPVLFLRVFRDDGARKTSLFELRTREGALMKYLRDLGPVLALGAPGERLPQLGAHRIYAPHESWQDVASRLMALSQLIILRGADSPGDSPGMEWELLYIRQNIDPQKVVLWITAGRQQAAYLSFRDTVQRCWNVTLPKRLNGREFIVFGSQWEPRTVRSLLGTDDTFRQPYQARELSMWKLLVLEAHSETTYLLEAMRRRAVTGYDRNSLLQLLRPIPLEVPPPFHLHRAAFALLAVAWICAFLRPSLLIEIFMQFHEFFGRNSPLVAAGFECFAVGALAVSLAFSGYLRSPRSKALPTLIFCTVLLVDLVSFPWRTPLQGRTPLMTQAQIDAETAAVLQAGFARMAKEMSDSGTMLLGLPELDQDFSLDTRFDELLEELDRMSTTETGSASDSVKENTTQ